jgi:hypothetical protein
MPIIIVLFMTEVMMSEYELINSLARFWGGMGLILSLIFLLRKDSLKSLITEFENVGSLSFSVGLMTLFIGLASASIYSRISFDWRVILTIFGWASIAKGVWIITMPKNVKGVIESKFYNNYAKASLVILGGLGLFLLIKSFQ